MDFSRKFTLSCPDGMHVTLLEMGAALAGVDIPDRDGVFVNVALAPRSSDDPSYAGVILAPYAGRIAKGKIQIDGRTVQLQCNEGENQLHGGRNSPARKIWRNVGMREREDYQEIAFSIEAADGLDGFPGSRYFTAVYRLYRDHHLVLTLTAESDKPTRVNLSHHAYFNMSGDFTRDISGQYLQIDAEEVYQNDREFLPADRSAVIPSLDFRQARLIGLPHGHPQIEMSAGLNHCYVLRKSGTAPAAVLYDPVSGRRMQLFTDQPCLTAYTGGYLDVPNCAIALEAVEHPLCRFAPETPLLYPGRIYQRKIIYYFDIAVTDDRYLKDEQTK